MKRLVFYALILLTSGVTACTSGGVEAAVSPSATQSDSSVQIIAQNDEEATGVTPAPTAYPTPNSEISRPDSCPITQQQEPRFVPPKPYSETAPDGSFWYGTNELWLDLRTNGTWYGLPKSDTGYGNKIALWHEGYSQELELQPEITLSAQQLDGEAVVEPVVYGTNAYHPDYGQFMMTGIELPTVGCWEITAKYQDASLSFVVWVAP